MMAGRTVLSIAHRLSTIKTADSMAVLQVEHLPSWQLFAPVVSGHLLKALPVYCGMVGANQGMLSLDPLFPALMFVVLSPTTRTAASSSKARLTN